MSSSVPRVLALGPAGMPQPGMVVAASRAGSLGILDFAIGSDLDGARAAARVVSRLGTRPFGLRLSAETLARCDASAWPANLALVVATEPDDGDWSRPLQRAREAGWTFLAEVTSRASAQAASTAGADGLIVAGHEAGGRGGEESSFVLLQGVLAQAPAAMPVWVRGGVGLRVASACVAAGARGVVLDGTLLLARESPLAEAVRERIERWDGSETTVLGRATARPLRVHAAPTSAAAQRLRVAESEGSARWEAATVADVGWRPDQAWPAGQDAALATGLARRFVTVGGIVQAFERSIDEGSRQSGAGVLAEGSPLAVAQGTRYPIVQGPMTRVSDSVAFAEAVADGGGLPFLALALMRGAEVRSLLAEACERLAGRSWGVGILGFVPPELRLEQIAAIREAQPPFALIAGGRPDQARELEREGIPTYLHVPSPGLLRQYLHKEGARRFVLEGRECGGHVGPRSSFLLWEQAVELVGEAIDQGIAAADIHLLFAGGIHDACSAAMVATIAAPLAARGVRVGVLVGTAYLFTAEAVATGAIVAGFQAEAVRCARTILLQTGPGHEVRVSPTPFADVFEAERRRLLADGRPPEEIRAALEDMNVGRLRVAAKGVDRTEGRGSAIVTVAPAEQTAGGLYMVGQVAALRDRVTTIAALHHDISAGSVAWLERQESIQTPSPTPQSQPQPSDVAIVGMAALFPGAGDVRTFWENTLNGHDAITEIPADRWDWRLYYDADPKAPDKITSKWGGFLPEVPFDPLRYGMPPTSVPSIEPMQLLTLEVVRAALDDAGYRDRPFPRERTAVVLGAGGGAAQLAMGYAFRSYLPLLDTLIPGGGQEALRQAGQVLPEWTEDSFPGILLNVAAGRVSNRFDLGGANYTVDAACGSSLAAAALAVRELETGAADMVILGGADTVQNPFTYLAFSKTQAFSARGRCRPFDAGADGIVISEGVAALVLKRLADAERDGDRIYAVIKGLGASSDGRAKGLTAPRPEGQVSALERAYEKAGVAADTVGYVEAHGTGTAAGDLAEIGALT
ncbi:MAG TPA: beta-ketoacyl synthase N-terminal-like domain-containing protein, partial [Isosphaeraceae bacterium]|nr:beta-ketoacyl synthase N-terminal-like domain-containing protein [Isosphaeraceae bacterium]